MSKQKSGDGNKGGHLQTRNGLNRFLETQQAQQACSSSWFKKKNDIFCRFKPVHRKLNKPEKNEKKTGNRSKPAEPDIFEIDFRQNKTITSSLLINYLHSSNCKTRTPKIGVEKWIPHGTSTRTAQRRNTQQLQIVFIQM